MQNHFLFDTTVPQKQRSAQIQTIIQDPHCFCVGDIEVTLRFSENAPTLQNSIINFLKRKKRGL